MADPNPLVPLAQQPEVNKAKDDLEKTTARLRKLAESATNNLGDLGPAPMKKYTVKMKDGTVYRGVMARSPEEASQKMLNGPQGPLAPTPEQAKKAEADQNYVAKEKARVTQGMVDILKDAGKSDEEIAQTVGRISGKLPENWTQVAGMSVPPIIAAMIPGGKSVSRFMGALGGNILGRGLAGAAGAAYEGNPDGPLAAGVEEAKKGVIPGLVQGTLGTILGPSKTTMNVNKAAKSLQEALSPELAAQIDPSKPASLLSKDTVNKLYKTAGGKLDQMEEAVSTLLGPDFRFKIGEGPLNPTSEAEKAIRKNLGLKAGEPLPAQWLQGAENMPTKGNGNEQTFSELRAKIRALRTIGEKQYASAEMNDRARAAMNEAKQLEATMLQQMPENVRGAYGAALAEHAKDSQAIRELKAVQQRNATSGGNNPIDNPELMKFDQTLNQRSGGFKAGLHGALGAAEALTGRPMGAGYHLGRAADFTGRGTGPLNPAASYPGVFPRTIIPGLAGAAASAGQDQLINNQKDEETE